jgi:hypothetical protein
VHEILGTAAPPPRCTKRRVQPRRVRSALFAAFCHQPKLAAAAKDPVFMILMRSLKICIKLVTNILI